MIPDWFRVDCDIVDSPKVGRLADALRIDVAKAIGHVIGIFAKVRQQRPLDGSLAGVSDTTLEQWALWRGRAGRFAAAFRAEFIADDILCGWSNRQAPLIRRVLAERERAKRNRERTGEQESADDTPTSTRTRSRTVLRQQEQEQEQRAKEASSSPARRALESVLRADHHVDLGELLARLPPDQRPAWTRKLYFLVRPTEAPAMRAGAVAHDPAAVGEAVREFNANGGDNWAHFEGHLRRVEHPPAPNGAGPHRGPGRESPADITRRNSRRALDDLLGPDGGISLDLSRRPA